MVKADRLAGTVTFPAGIPRVLCFHKLSDSFLIEGTWTTPARFAAMIDRLLDRGWVFVDETAYLAALGSPSREHANAVFITFDDGYAHLRDTALPILQKREIPFHVFMVTDFAGRENTWELSLGRKPTRHLTWDEIQEMSRHNVTFGSHTASHNDVTRMDAAALAGDLARSRRDLEAATGKPVRTLSYPFGRYNAAAQAAARAAGFDAAFSLYPKTHAGAADRFALRRDPVYIIDPVWTIERKLVPNWLYGWEETKGRAINAVAVLTPLLKR